MSNQNAPISPILESAWKRNADYGNTAKHQKKQYYRLRRWVLIFSIIATTLAILLENIRIWFPEFPVPVIRFLQVILILVPLIGSGIVAYINTFKQGQQYLSMRAGAEETLKYIFLYRTVMQGNIKRNQWLNNRLADVQREVHRSLGGDVVLKPYSGKHINPRYYPDSPDADEGLADLDSAEYIRVRLESQRDWHIKKIQEHHQARVRLTISILLFGGLGALFAGLDIIFAGAAVWVALTTAVSTAFTNWQQLLGVEAIIPNYSKVILELNILHDYWLSLSSSEQTQAEFYKLVRKTEKVLWSQHVQFISAMKESMDEAEAEQEKIIEDAIEMSQEVTGRVQEEIIEEARRSMEEAEQAAVGAAAGLTVVDDQRLPAGTIFNAALGPARAVIVGEDVVDAPDGFENDTQVKMGPQASKEEPAVDIQDDDSMLAEINSAVVSALEESEAVKSSTTDIADDVTKAAQEAADEYIQNATDAFEDEGQK